MPHTLEWTVPLHLFEDDAGTTKAHLILDTGTTELTGHGTAHCHPADSKVPKAGEAEVEEGSVMTHPARHEGLASSFVPQPLEWTDLRWSVRVPMTGTGYTQVLLRLGYGPNGPSTPRRAVCP